MRSSAFVSSVEGSVDPLSFHFLIRSDGVIAERYLLVETPSKRYGERTRWNVRDSDATLILALGELSGGSRLTADAARSAAKPLLVGRLDLYETARAVEEFVEAHRVRTLNVAGPRESRCRGIHARAYALLRTVFADLERGRGLILREGSRRGQLARLPSR